MKVDYIEETSVRKALTFEIEPEVLEKEVEARARQYARKVKIPGFRPGKIPPDVIRQRFRHQVLEDAAEAIVNRVVFEELEGRGLKPLTRPQVTDLKVEENRPLTFRAVFETLPLVEVPDFRDLPVKARRPSVSEEDLDRDLERLREEAARYDPVEGRPAQEGDFLVLDVSWVPGESNEAEAGMPGGATKRPLAQHDDNVLVELGSDDNHPDLNATLAGMTAGETKSVRLVYPADHRSEALAGKTVDYTVTLKAIKQKVVPAADDEFAKDLDFDSLTALREGRRQRLLASAERQADREVKNAILEELVKRSSFEVPDALVERHMSARTESAARGLALQGIDPARAGLDWRQYREAQRADALKAAKADILLDEIARREGIEVREAEVEAEVARYAEGLKKSKEAIRGQMEKEGTLTGLRARIREEKTLDLLKANARLDFE